MLQRGGWDVEPTIETPDFFLFAIQGPRALEITEEVIGADLKHLRFSQFQEFSVDDIPLRVLRTGVTGELGYELHGPSSHGDTIWAKVVEAGQDFDMKQLGARAQMVSHVEAGIANNEYDFFSVPTEIVGNAQRVPIGTGPARRSFGSYRPKGRAELYRTPAELNWVKQVSLDSHDFIGRNALLAERKAGGPSRHLVGLVWNGSDIAQVFSSLFGDEVVLQMEMPRYNGLELNHVTAAGKK
jgi:glycine cleavage system aminomethyltransferase T